jgi:Cysteine-rich secretory protein family
MQLLVDGHNKYRNMIALGKVSGFQSAKRMAKVTWNNELAKLAELNTKQCDMKHDDCRNTRE